MLSVHFRAENFCSFAIEDVEFLQKYNIHILPYCTCVKGRQQVQCAAENQRAIGNGTVPYVRICPAGVAEYHQTFSRFGEFVGGRYGQFRTCRNPPRPGTRPHVVCRDASSAGLRGAAGFGARDSAVD